jgi:hypothetical protein
MPLPHTFGGIQYLACSTETFSQSLRRVYDVLLAWQHGMRNFERLKPVPFASAAKLECVTAYCVAMYGS